MGKTPNYVQTEKHYDAKDSFYIQTQKILHSKQTSTQYEIQTKTKEFYYIYKLI